MSAKHLDWKSVDVRSMRKTKLLVASAVFFVAGSVLLALAYNARSTPCFKSMTRDQTGGLRVATVQDWAKCQESIDAMRKALGGVTFSGGVTLYYGGGGEPALTAELQAILDSIKRRTFLFGLGGVLCLGVSGGAFGLALRRKRAAPVALQEREP